MAVVLANYLTVEDFRQVFTSLAPAGGYVILERPQTSTFERFSRNIDWAAWDAGRVFDEGLDLRWQRSDGIFHVVMISDAPQNLFPPRFQLDLAENHIERTTRWLLWGVMEEGGRWVERRMPRIFSYPVSGRPGSRVALSVTEYVNALNSQVEFYRFTGLEEVSPS